MADDPNRDILPVKEGSCIETCRSTWVAGLIADPRERHAVCKLDRYDLEDRYLCLLDETQALKKLSNAQEDKLKRLTTRLMRISASSRPCIAAALTIDSNKIKIEELERENLKLKDRIFVMKNQLLSHKGLKRSPPRRCLNCISSRPTTCRSEGARTKISTSTTYGEGKGDFHSQNDRIEELQQQRQGMMSRISELEDELINCQTELQKTKVDENIEYIRMLRQMKQQKEQLASSHSINTSLEEEMRVLKQQLDETSSKNGKISAALLAEKHRLTELDETLSKSKNSQLALREKEEQIHDLMSEIKILQQNNSELISLSTKNSEVELENIELRRKISEQQVDNHNLKSAFSNEQANITALQAVNAQLMGKLQEMQREMDTLTVQLKSFQNQNEKPKKPEERKIVPTLDKTTSTSPRSRRSSKGESDYSSKEPQKLPQVSEKVEAAVQTEQIEIPPPKFCSTERLNAPDQIKNSPSRNHGKPVETMTGANLSRDEILKLLDQAQINVPLESHNAAKMRQFEGFSPVHRQRQVVALETLLFGDTGYS
ncbi:protein fantom [Diachasma alloeum]|uniref:protein fantom n=1 Tax=Diachasma alloeum TaxID=454923 RepID=UPI0007381455|nr:protein fantom [Diachasma alloeum]